MKALENKEPNYGARMFCDRFEKPPTLEEQFRVIQKAINDLLDLYIDAKIKRVFPIGGIIHPNIKGNEPPCIK